MLASACFIACDQEPPPLPKLAPTVVAAPKPVEPQVPREETLEFKLDQTSKPVIAAQLLAPMMENSHEKISQGARLFARWSAAKLSWASLSRVPKATYSEAMKDPEAERGKRICFRGSVSQITAETALGPKLYVGTLNDYSYNTVRYIAVRSTGKLVSGSQARFCGVFTERHSYSNLGGGTTEGVFLVGMFDLPENRQAI